MLYFTVMWLQVGIIEILFTKKIVSTVVYSRRVKHLLFLITLLLYKIYTVFNFMNIYWSFFAYICLLFLICRTNFYVHTHSNFFNDSNVYKFLKFLLFCFFLIGQIQKTFQFCYSFGFFGMLTFKTTSLHSLFRILNLLATIFEWQNILSFGLKIEILTTYIYL